MKIITQDISIRSDTFTLTNHKVIYWQRIGALILSDWHIGKAAFFNQHGIPIPRRAHTEDIVRMDRLIQHFLPQKIIIVGDLLHADINSDVHDFGKWRQQYPYIEFQLVSGNHDRRQRYLLDHQYIDASIKTLTVDDYLFSHDRIDAKGLFQINGHIHPGVRLKSRVSRIKLPCYFITDDHLLLPAYSDFTGLNVQEVHRAGKIIVWTDDELIQIS